MGPGKSWKRHRLMRPSILQAGEVTPPLTSSERAPIVHIPDSHTTSDTEVVEGLLENGPAVFTEVCFQGNGRAFVASDNDGRVTVWSFGSAPLYNDVPFDQYLSDENNPIIMDDAFNVADATTQLPPHARFQHEVMCGFDMLPLPDAQQWVRARAYVMYCGVPTFWTR